MFGDEFFERPGVHVALERVVGREVGGFLAGQVDGVAADEVDVAARGVEMCVVRHDRVGFDHDAKENMFRGAALVRRNDLLKAENILHRVTETVPAAGAGVRLVAAHECAPGLG